MSSNIDIAELLKKILRGHGISFVFTDESTYTDSASIDYFPVEDGTPFLDIDDAVSSHVNPFTSALLSESYAFLRQDVRIFIEEDEYLPIDSDDEGLLRINDEASLPLSTIIYALDLTVERLTALAKEHNLVEGTGISLSWLQRGLKLLDAQDDAELDKDSQKEIVRFALNPHTW